MYLAIVRLRTCFTRSGHPVAICCEMFDNATGRPKCAINVLYGTMLQYITQRAERKPIVCCTERKKKKEVSDTNSATLIASQWFVYNLFLPEHQPFQSQVPFTLRRGNLKIEVSLWKRIKSFSSTLRQRNSKMQQSLIILDLIWGKLRQGNHVIMTSSFLKSSVFKMFSIHTKTKSQRF